MHRCPVVPNAPQTAPSTARSTSASSMTRIAFLPPISRCRRLNVGAQAFEMLRPTSVEPVYETTLTSGCWTSGSPTSPPEPMTTLKTPAGRPASSKTRASATTDAGVSVAGLMTIVLPAISAAMDFHAGIAIGKFHGVTSAQTPTGWRTHIAHLFGSSDGVVKPNSRRPSPAARNAMSIASWTSPRVSARTLPISRVMRRASFSLSRFRISPAA